MNRSLLWRFLLIVFVVGWAGYSLYPWKTRPLIDVFQENVQRPDATIKEINAKYLELHKANPQNDYGNLREAIGTNDITKYFAFDNLKTERDPTRAVLNQLQRLAASKIKLGLDLQGGSSFLLEMETGKLATNVSKKAAVDNAVEVLRKRVDKFGVAEPMIQPEGENRILVQMPGLSEAEAESVRVALSKPAFLEFRLVHEDSQKLLQEGIIPPGYELMREKRENPDGTTSVSGFIVSKSRIAGLSGKNLTRAGVGRDNFNRPEILFNLDSDGAIAFEKVTTDNVGRLLAIILDGELYSAPRINGPIPGGHGSITGDFSDKQAFELASILQNPLEAPLKLLSEDRVDASLGVDTIKSGINSALYGTIAVAAFMAVYYLFAGVVANVALLTNIVVLLGVMCAFGTTLTLPGIAGIVLTVGMAVDANVLIFERIREESAKGKSLRGALAAGYSRAFGTIFDSHVTTLISSIILIYMGTGTIKGFGVALTIGVSASLFTALVVTRVIFDFMIGRNLLKSMPMLHVIRNTKIDFMKFAMPAFIASWTIIAVGVGWGVYRGAAKHDLFGIEFLGGENLTIEFKERVDVDKIRKAIEPVAGADAMIQYQRALAGTDEKLRIVAPYEKGVQTTNALAKAFPSAGFHQVGSQRVGPTVGEEILRSAVIASLLSLLGILIYVALRYEFSFAVGAVVAVIHDVLMTIGIYALAGRQLNATMVAAILTIIGFSINDTIVIFDRIREDLKLGVRGTFRDLINQALNQTLSRTIITSGTVFLATMALFLFGGGAINDFAFTFLIGIITGTYSSICIASALVLWWHKGQRPTASSQVIMEGGSSSPTNEDDRASRGLTRKPA